MWEGEIEEDGVIFWVEKGNGGEGYGLNERWTDPKTKNVHRLGGKPARISGGNNPFREWREEGLLHNLTGPAFIRTFQSTGQVVKEWWIRGEQIKVNSQEEFERFLKLQVFS